MKSWLAITIRWGARVTALMLAGLVFALAVGHGGPPNIFRQPPPVQFEFMAMSLMIFGFLIGWRWELWGGMLALTGFVLFFATEFLVNGQPPGGAIPLFAVPSILLILSSWLGTSMRGSS